MKKTFLYVAAMAVIAFATFSAFADEVPAEEQITKKVEEMTAAFLAEQDSLCKAKAVEAAIAEIAEMDAMNRQDDGGTTPARTNPRPSNPTSGGAAQPAPTTPSAPAAPTTTEPTTETKPAPTGKGGTGSRTGESSSSSGKGKAGSARTGSSSSGSGGKGKGGGDRTGKSGGN